MITEDYVSYETAKLLKEKGFDEMTELVYGLENGQVRADLPVSYWRNSEIGDYRFSCPTIQMAIKWLEEVHNILLIPDYDYECTDKSWYYKIFKLGENGKPKRVPLEGVGYDINGELHVEVVEYRDYEKSFTNYATKEEACEAGIRHCLENLI